ncbi:GH1 family beta-glucosidase [Alkalihalobacterium bogoriense]|uniref:GH1 family beta-glucosidase n=1 Tax=Alkalihalobacterium bogoriense TaxID=246272 RepID=UPI00047BE472|nr:GH1 family beta-glucosidase [Alkalihalobacterium bogoriense]
MLKFPNDFVWGTATSSYQIEGAAREDGKGESIWDQFSRIPGKVHNNDTGIIACDHYHLYESDIKLMKELGIKSYRFSVSWPRIFPNGTGQVNERGLDFYKRIIDTLLENGITPALTMYHWDLPQALQDKGGWTNRDIVDYFVDYGSVLFKNFGDVVDNWITHNEPWVVSYLGYGSGEHAPGYQDFPSFVKASHHLLLSHGKTVQAFRESGIIGKDIGITLNLNPAYPAFDGEEYEKATNIYDGFMNRWFLDPVFNGSYPKEILDLYSQFVSLDFIKEDDLNTIANPIDFLGINYYSITNIIPAKDCNQHFLGFESVKKGLPTTGMNWEIYSQGLYDLLTRIKSDYNDPKIYITENGAAFDDELIDGKVNDENRISYVKEHLDACHRAIQDGVNLKGYYLWSFMDNFEWAYGYDKRFGMTYVDYETQKRIPKKSAYWYSDVIKNNGF